MAETTIEWTATKLPYGRLFPGYTFNAWQGCQKVSAACDFCYAEAITTRFNQGNWGPRARRRRTSDAYWKQPLKWNRRAGELGVQLKVFSLSMGDWADNHWTIEQQWRDDHWSLIRSTPNLIWLLLTKRSSNIPRYLPADWGTTGYPNVWLGTTIESRPEMMRRGPELARVPAVANFWSCEPLLADLGEIPQSIIPDWIIAGGESGPGARPSDHDWFINLRDQCAARGTAFFMKQMGGKRKPFPPIPDDLMIREWPA